VETLHETDGKTEKQGQPDRIWSVEQGNTSQDRLRWARPEDELELNSNKVLFLNGISFQKAD